MASVVLSGLAAFLLVSGNLLSNTEAADSTLKYVFAVCRHATRTPDSPGRIPGDPNTENSWPGAETITKNGLALMVHSGDFLNTRYRDFVKGLAKYDIQVTAPPLQFVQDSVQVLANSFLGCQFGNERCLLSTDSIYYMDKYELYTVLDPDAKTCPKFEKHKLEIMKNYVNVDVTDPERKKLLAEITEKANEGVKGNPEDKYTVSTPWDVLNLWDTLYMEKMDERATVSWAGKYFPSKLEPIVADTMSQILRGSSTTPMLDYITAPLFWGITERFRITTGKGVHIHATLDSTLASLMWALGLTHFPHVGATVILELHQDNSIKAFYYEPVGWSSSDKFEEVPLAGVCGEPCTLDLLLKKVQVWGPEEWSKKCQQS